MKPETTWIDTVETDRETYAWTDIYGQATEVGNFDFGNCNAYRLYSNFTKVSEPNKAVYERTSLHDTSIGFHVLDTLHKQKGGVVAFMGGHKLPRNSAMYASIVELSAKFTREGYLVISGGGPGAMEATHLGALMANYDKEHRTQAIKVLSKVNEFPSIAGQLKKNLRYGDPKNGETQKELKKILAALTEWLKPALELRAKVDRDAETEKIEAGYSLSIPTFLYGHEPATPFATDIAMMFQNSIREEAVLAHARSGIVFCPGGPGTIQEVFQDSAQNYYLSFDEFSPMIFLADASNPDFWTSKPTLEGHKVIDRRPVKDLLDACYINATPQVKDSYENYVRFTTEPGDAFTIVEAYREAQQKR